MVLNRRKRRQTRGELETRHVKEGLVTVIAEAYASGSCRGGRLGEAANRSLGRCHWTVYANWRLKGWHSGEGLVNWSSHAKRM
jgi:hypothetical protein